MIKSVSIGLAAAMAATLAVASASGAIIVSEVHPTGSSASYAADWFELTNTGATAVDITGWKVDDSSNLFTSAVAIRNITSIPAGASVVFFEGNSTGTTDATIAANFQTAWFGASVPSGFLIGAYGGSGIGLSSAGDAVNIFDAAGVAIASVTFGASTVGTTLDNAAGLSGALSSVSVSGLNGAFVSTIGEVGSPGLIPTPGACSLLGLGLLAAAKRTRR